MKAIMPELFQLDNWDEQNTTGTSGEHGSSIDTPETPDIANHLRQDFNSGQSLLSCYPSDFSSVHSGSNLGHDHMVKAHSVNSALSPVLVPQSVSTECDTNSYDLQPTFSECLEYLEGDPCEDSRQSKKQKVMLAAALLFACGRHHHDSLTVLVGHIGNNIKVLVYVSFHQVLLVASSAFCRLLYKAPAFSDQGLCVYPLYGANSRQVSLDNACIKAMQCPQAIDNDLPDHCSPLAACKTYSSLLSYTHLLCRLSGRGSCITSL